MWNLCHIFVVGFNSTMSVCTVYGRMVSILMMAQGGGDGTTKPLGLFFA